MSTPQAAEESLTYTQFLAEIVGRFESIDALGVYSNGTRVICRRGGVARAFLISDLTGSKVVLIANDETTFTDTVTNIPAKSLSIPANSFSNILIESEVELDGDNAIADHIEVSFTPTAGHFWHLKQESVAAQNAILACRASLVYSNKAAHTASVNVTVALGAASYFVYNFRAWGIT